MPPHPRLRIVFSQSVMPGRNTLVGELMWHAQGLISLRTSTGEQWVPLSSIAWVEVLRPGQHRVDR